VTVPLPSDTTESFDVLRKRWWQRYLTVQAKSDTQIRTVLVQAASDAQDRITALTQNSTFSAGVRTAQVRLAMNEMKSVHKDLFGDILPIITSGQKDEAGAAIDGFTETDIQFLQAAFSSTGAVESFIKSQRLSAVAHVTNAIQRVTKTNIPLSSRVYRSQSLANNWIQNKINVALATGAGARDLAKTVKSQILPTTPGGTSYAALRLGRTELNNAFHATAIEAAQDRPWITGMRWYVSDRHEDDPKEICTKLAGQLFDVDAVPPKPHPQCRCFVAPEVETLDVFTRHLTAGQYRDWIENAA
jgi:hypothetical protein